MIRKFLLGIVLSLIFVSPTLAAPRVAVTCGWDGTVLWAENLPAEWAATSTFYPIGVTARPSSFREDYGTAFTVWFWTRKGPGSGDYPKPGKQLNDYKVVCIAQP